MNVWSPTCYWCRGYQRVPAMDQDIGADRGHKPNCQRQVAIDALESLLEMR